MTATLLVTIDTEEEFDWLAPITRESRSVAHAAHLPRLQELFDEVGARPTYVVDYPIATSELSVEVLGGFLRRGACEIGAHIHPWVNPPEKEAIEPRNSYLCNLPLALQQEKVHCLTEAIERAFGARPTTFKAGRYGLDFALVPYLKQLGYTVDTSVIAYMDFSDDEGPDFRRFGNEPFPLEPPLVPQGAAEATTASTSVPVQNGRAMLEVPCTVGFSRRPFGFWSRVHHRLSQDRYRMLRPIGIMWHLQVMRKIVLTPEGTETADQLRLLKVLGRDPGAVLNVTLHSPSIQPGNTPYVQSDEDVERLLARLRATLRFALDELQAEPMTFSELYRRKTAT